MTTTLDDFRVLVMPGLYGSGAGHWQTRWQQLHPAFERVEQDNWDVPDLDAWSERLAQTLRASRRPALIVAHSFGCLTTIHRAGFGAGNVAGALLVAPADPARFGLEPRLQHAVLPFPALMISSTNDPWMPHARAVAWAQQWQAQFVDVGALGHINADSGLGDWPFGLAQLQLLLHRLPPVPAAASAASAASIVSVAAGAVTASGVVRFPQEDVIYN